MSPILIKLWYNCITDIYTKLIKYVMLREMNMSLFYRIIKWYYG